VPAQQPAGAQADAGVAADVPALPDLEARARTVRSNLKSFTFNISWAQDITDAFMGLTPADFQRLQELLGDHDMDDAFDQLTPFMATLIGTYGPVTKGSEKLNAKRVEFIVETKDWGSVKETFYRWMFETMSIGDITLVVRQLGAQKRLRETIFTVTGLAESLVKRGVDATAFNEEQTTWSEGAQRGLAHVWRAAWASTIFASGPSGEYSYLPANYQESYSSNLEKDFFKAFEPANAARGMASNVTLGLSDVPVGIYAAGDATVHGAIDLWDGKTGDAAEKFTPVVMMILMALAGRAAGKLATAPALEESALLETRMPPGAVPLPGGARPILYEVRSLGKTAEGLDRYLVRDASGELAEMTVDLQKRTIRATHLATGDVVTYENGQISRGPAGLLPPGAGAGGVADEIQPIRAAQTAPPMKPASLPENLTPAGDLVKTPAVRPAAGPVNLPLPSTPRTAAADLRVTQAQDALAAATKTASAQRDAVLAAQQDLDAARALKTEAGRLASARDLVREQQAILGAAQAALRPISASEALAIADYAQVLEAQKQIVGLEGEVARLESELGQQLNPPGGFSREARLAGRRPWITPTWNQPGGLAYYALTAQLDAARTRLAGWVRDLTVSLGDQVAAATPGPAARPAALSNARSLSSEALHPVNGAPIDVTTGMPMRTADWATDHVMSRTEIASDPRFPRLSPMKRLEILLNVPENYLPFTRKANSSKGIQSVEEWIAAREKTNPISESMKQALREADQRARAAIETFFRDNEGK
jgi:hypothetical protein